MSSSRSTSRPSRSRSRSTARCATSGRSPPAASATTPLETARSRRFYLDADHHSKKYDDAPMPHSRIFFTDQGHALHGTFSERQLGTPASHGCVRLDRGNATALFALVKSEGREEHHDRDHRQCGRCARAQPSPGGAGQRRARDRGQSRAAAACSRRRRRRRDAATMRSDARGDKFSPVRMYPQPVAQPTYRQAFAPLSATPPVAPPNLPALPPPGRARSEPTADAGRYRQPIFTLPPAPSVACRSMARARRLTASYSTGKGH